MIEQIPTACTWFPTDTEFLGFVKDRLVLLGSLLVILKAMFPDSKILRAIGEATSRIPKIRIPKIGGKKWEETT